MHSKTVSARDVRITSPFWSARQEIARTQGIPYQLSVMQDRVPGADPSHALRNFRIAAGMEQGEHYGYIFQDSDAAKWLEAAAFSLMWHPDAELEAQADDVIDLIGKAQLPDGYLSTYHIIHCIDKRFTNLADDHELYIAGHMAEAAAAYYQATGKRKLLDIVIRMIDCISRSIGPEEGKIHGYPGHPVLEMALVRLYRLTDDKKYLELAKYFIDQRGQQPLHFKWERDTYAYPPRWAGSAMGLHYYQADKPVREQQNAVGHAVRAAYLYSGMADAALETGDESLMEACRRMWRSITRRRMYVTGAIGSHDFGEAFTYDYDLPNDSAYAETCAAIALVFFARRMLAIEAKSEYADVMERTLYNCVLSGMDLDGRRFFYVNPLEVVPEACDTIRTLRHVDVPRRPWFGCACCPPNLMRMLTSLGEYICTVSYDTLYMHLYIGADMHVRIGGADVGIEMQSDMPWNGKTVLKFGTGTCSMFSLALRIPEWCTKWSVIVNGAPVGPEVVDGYAMVRRAWAAGDTIQIDMDMPVRLMRADPRVRADMGMVCVARGPVVYCCEEADNGKDLHLIHLDPREGFVREKTDELAGITALHCTAYREKLPRDGALYSEYVVPEYEPVALKLIPYYAWANRGRGEMRVWMPVRVR